MASRIIFTGGKREITEISELLSSNNETVISVDNINMANQWFETITQIAIAIIGSAAFSSFITERIKADRIEINTSPDGTLKVSCTKKTKDAVIQILKEYYEFHKIQESTQKVENTYGH